MSIEKPTIVRHIDPELGDRYNHLAALAKKRFANTGLTNPQIPITENDLEKIRTFYWYANPLRTSSPWRNTNSDERRELPQSKIVAGDITYSYERLATPDSYGNWEAAGGPLEHITLASHAIRIIARELSTHLKDKIQIPPEFDTHLDQIQNIDPLKLQAIALLHDVGRLFTHTFFTNDRIGQAFLKRVGIRADIINATPDESVMLVLPPKSKNKDLRISLKNSKGKPVDSPNVNMGEMFQRLSAEAIIMRIADEFGKRAPKKNALYTPEDYSDWDRQQWVKSYTTKLNTGRISDNYFRANQQLHVDNVPRYFDFMDYWVGSISTLSLKDLTDTLQRELGENEEMLPRFAQ